jgi:type II protein arginine methyltransferase
VPKWHFNIVRDDARNAAYEAAIVRAVRPDARILDIGAGTGLLAMMAARAGAKDVITCEMNPAVADAAADIVARNGHADRVRVVPKRSTELDVAADMGERPTFSCRDRRQRHAGRKRAPGDGSTRSSGCSSPVAS